MKLKFLSSSIFFIFLSILAYPFIVVGGLAFLLLGKINFANFFGKIGFFPLSTSKSTSKKDSYLWIHLSSLGEWNTAKIFIQKLSKEMDNRVLITYFNQDLREYFQNQNQNQEILSQEVVTFFLPLENILSYWLIIKHYRIKALIIVETEIWPILILINRWMRKKIFLVNATLFDHEAENYLKLNFFFSPIINCFDKIYCISENSKKNFLLIQTQDSKLKVEKNFKYDLMGKIINNIHLDEIFEKLKQSHKKILLNFASFHLEEMKTIFPKIKEYFNNPRIMIIIAPRDISQIKLWEKFFIKKKIILVKKTNLDKKGRDLADIKHIILDTYGELVNIFKHSDLVIMGGSFIPIGGHNFLEAVYFDKPIVLGPYFHHFKELVDDFKDYINFSNKQRIGEFIKKFLINPKFFLKNNGAKKLKSYSGISNKIALEIVKKLEKSSK